VKNIHVYIWELINMDKLNLLKLFVMVVDEGSFAAAASAQGISPSTISKAIARLEQSLNLLLLHRSTRQLTLTEAGKTYLDTARGIIRNLEDCERTILQSNNQAQGVLRINMPVSYGRLYVLPLLKAFVKRYPDIELELSFNDAYVDIIEQGIDVAIRSGTLGVSNLIARQLSPMDYLICAAPSYLKKYGQPKNMGQFPQHKWIRFRFRQTGRIMPIMSAKKSCDPGSQFITDDGEALVSLCEQGAGITQIPHFLARDALKKGSIVSIQPRYRPGDQGVWAVYANREYLPEKIRVFIEYLQEQLAKRGEHAYSTWAEQLA